MVKIVTLTPSPAIDLSTSVPSLEAEHKLRCTSPRRDPGGGGINVARAAHRLGAEVLAVYPSGGPTGQLLDRMLVGEGVPIRPVPAHEDTRENFYVLEEASGRQFKFILPGPWLGLSEQVACIRELGLERRTADWLVCSGGLAPGAPDDLYARVAVAARDAGLRVAVDTHGAALAAALAVGVDLVKPSLRELEDLVGHGLPSEEDQIRACSDLVVSGQAGMIALSLGEQGAILVTGEAAWRATSPRVQTISSVGAGDSFLAALIVALASGQQEPQALRRAVAAGAAALLGPGTELCHAADVDRLAAQVQVSPLRLPTPQTARSRVAG